MLVSSSPAERRQFCSLCLVVLLSTSSYWVHASEHLSPTTGEMPMRVDFGYAFATPHRMTVALPDSSNKTLLDAYPEYLRMAWTFDDLRNKPLASFTTPKTQWEIRFKLEVDGKAITKSSWTRSEGWLPVLQYVFHDSAVNVHLEVAGGLQAAIARVEVENKEQISHRVLLKCERPSGPLGYNPAWVQPEWDRDVLLAGWNDRADRIILLAKGGDEQPVIASTTVSLLWNLKPGENRIGWVIRPYQAIHSMLPALRNKDWNEELEAAKTAWRTLIGKAARVRIPDEAVQNAFYAGLADCFIMREPVAGGYIAGCPGTEVYRAPSSWEPGIMAILFDQVGLHTESELGYRMSIDLQGADGNWCDPEGWAHYMWGTSGVKSWVIMEHYRLTGDKAYLTAAYPHMLASSRWQEQQRARTRVAANGERALTYGLMPRGMGDGGLKDGDDLYGVFFPHNILAVYADALSVQAAQILGKTADIPELKRIHQTALAALMQALKRGAISEDGYRWIPGVPGKTSGSLWGGLYAAFPCGILSPDHELISGTIRKFESHLSPGGIPVNTGWLRDGMWVAITLDNLAEVLLLRDQGDAAAKYLYATLNHGTPLYSWCEERGQEPSSKNITGDRQHLWTPLAVSRFIRDALVMEQGDTLHLARGIARQWLSSGQPLGVQNAVTHFGRVSYEIRYDKKSGRLNGTIELPDKTAPRVILHLRLPAGRKVKSVSSPAAAIVSEDAVTIEWPVLKKAVRFMAKVR